MKVSVRFCMKNSNVYLISPFSFYYSSKLQVVSSLSPSYTNDALSELVSSILLFNSPTVLRVVSGVFDMSERVSSSLLGYGVGVGRITKKSAVTMTKPTSNMKNSL